jgi:hypothetical protein
LEQKECKLETQVRGLLKETKVAFLVARGDDGVEDSKETIEEDCLDLPRERKERK